MPARCTSGEQRAKPDLTNYALQRMKIRRDLRISSQLVELCSRTSRRSSPSSGRTSGAQRSKEASSRPKEEAFRCRACPEVADNFPSLAHLNSDKSFITTLLEGSRESGESRDEKGAQSQPSSSLGRTVGLHLKNISEQERRLGAAQTQTQGRVLFQAEVGFTTAQLLKAECPGHGDKLLFGPLTQN